MFDNGRKGEYDACNMQLGGWKNLFKPKLEKGFAYKCLVRKDPFHYEKAIAVAFSAPLQTNKHCLHVCTGGCEGHGGSAVWGGAVSRRLLPARGLGLLPWRPPLRSLRVLLSTSRVYLVKHCWHVYCPDGLYCTRVDVNKYCYLIFQFVNEKLNHLLILLTFSQQHCWRRVDIRTVSSSWASPCQKQRASWILSSG